MGRAHLQHAAALRGRAVQVDPIKPTLKAPWTQRLKLKVTFCFQILVSNSTCAATPWCPCCRRMNPTTPKS